jgi:hypothetical protein
MSIRVRPKAINKVEVLGHYGALLSLVELGLGSVLHAFRVPFGGLFLSLNQGYLLACAAIKTGDPAIGYSISNVAAILKSLAPAGNKLGPMLSLSMQGLLFRAGLVFGVNLPGLIFGMILLSLWSFIQPLVTYYLFFGDALLTALAYVYEKTLPYHGIRKEGLFMVFLAVVAAKALLAAGLAVVAWRRGGDESFHNRLAGLARAKAATAGAPALLALRDLSRPLFLASLALTGVFLFFSQHRFAEMMWYLLRPLAVGFLFFYFSRTLTIDRWLARLRGGPLAGFARGCEAALAEVRKVL